MPATGIRVGLLVGIAAIALLGRQATNHAAPDPAANCRDALTQFISFKDPKSVRVREVERGFKTNDTQVVVAGSRVKLANYIMLVNTNKGFDGSHVVYQCWVRETDGVVAEIAPRDRASSRGVIDAMSQE
jgi:hypothetical protein